MYIVLELCQSSLAEVVNRSIRPTMSLTDATRQECAPLPSNSTRQFLRELVGGIAFLHLKKFVHRDIKPENVLLVTREGDEGRSHGDEELPFERLLFGQVAGSASGGAACVLRSASGPASSQNHRRYDQHDLGKDWRPKISDMGLGKDLGQASSFYINRTTGGGTRGWQAPELLRTAAQRSGDAQECEEGGSFDNDGNVPDDPRQEFGGDGDVSE